MALAPWNVLAGGKIRTDEEEEKRRQTGEKGRAVFNPAWERNEQEKTVCKALEKVAAEVGAKHITSGILFVSFKIFDIWLNVSIKSPSHILCKRHPMFSQLSEVERSSI